MCSALTDYHDDHEGGEDDDDHDLREDPKDIKMAPLFAESRKVCRFNGSGRAGLRCSPPTCFNGAMMAIVRGSLPTSMMLGR